MSKLSLSLTIPFLFVFNLIIAQELPDFTPPSPTPFELTKYGDVPINETSGKVNASVPIYEFKSGHLTVPIGLNYTGAGIKVDQLSSWTGINWNLSAGGVITRIVKDLPDEESVNTTNRVLLSADDLSNNMDLTVGSDDSVYLNTLANSNTKDTKADEFNFSFLNYSGSFYLDESYEPKLANYDQEIKIEFSGGVQNIDNQTIIITTNDGIEYRFGGVECEKTRIRHSSNPITDYYTTAYYLYQIVHPFGDTITFEYGDETNDSFEIKFSQQEESTELLGGNNNLCGSSAPTGYSLTNSFNKIYNGKYLEKIYSNRSDIEIFFNSEALDVNLHYKRRLNSIDVVNTSDSTDDQSMELDYIMDSTRFFLEHVTFFNGNNTENYKYKLEYNNPLDLPDRFSFAKDHLGYYNGQSTNTTLLPISSHYKFVNGISGIGTLANREPNINYAKKGTLTKIHYPTKGFTNFEYEGSPVRVDQYTGVNLKAYSNLAVMYPGAYPDPDTVLENYIDLQGDDVVNGLHKTQNVTFNITAVAQGNLDVHDKVRLIIEEGFGSNRTIVDSKVYNLDINVYNYSWEYETTLEEGKIYRITLELDPDSESNPPPVDVNMNFRFSHGYSIEEGLGVRVKRVTDYSSNGIIANTKRFFYDKIEDVLNNSSYLEDYNYDSLYLSSNQYVSCCYIAPGIAADSFHLIKLSSETANSIFPSSDGLNYKTVTISYGGDSFEGGGIEKTFKNNSKIYTINYLHNYDAPSSVKQFETDKSNYDIFNGKVVSEKFIVNKNNTLFINKVNNYNYLTIQPEHVENMQIKRMYDVCSVQESNLNSLTGLYIGFYKTFVNELVLNDTENILYIEPVPITALANANNYKHVLTSTQYEYNSYVGQPTKITTTTSDVNKVLETKNYYVDQVGQLSGLTIDQINAYGTLDSKYRLGNIIQSESYVIEGVGTPQLLSTQRTIFKNWNSGALVLPELIQTSKGNETLENRIRFYDYTVYGNLLEASKESGRRIRYVYDTKLRVIRKIENYDPSTNVSAIGSNTSTTPCYYQNQHPNSMVSVYNYIGDSKRIESIEDSRCNKITYHYDEFNRLKFVKDKDGNILNKNEYNYKN